MTCHWAFWRRITGRWFTWCWKCNVVTKDYASENEALSKLTCCKGESK